MTTVLESGQLIRIRKSLGVDVLEMSKSDQ